MGGYIGAKTGTLVATASNIKGDISATDTTPEITLKNTTETDADGGRSSKITFKGEQSGGEESTLAQIQASHDAAADDEKGDLIFKTNDGSDGASPTERLRIDSAGSIIPATLGTNNTHLGEGAAASIVSGGNNNTAIGYNAGNAITTGDKNTAVGVSSLTAVTTGADNTGLGYNSGTSITTGNYNTLLGFQAGDAITTGSSNVAVGYNALSAEDGNGLNVAIGANALGNLNAGANAENVAVGHDAGASATTGGENTIVGATAGDALTIGEKNVAIGHNALGADDVGSRNTAVGWDALGSQNAAGASVNNYYNVAVGANAGFSNVNGYYNTFVGSLAGDGASAGLNNVAVGYGALRANCGNNNTAVGEGALAVATGQNNTAIGNYAGNQITTGQYNTILGQWNGNQDGFDIRTESNCVVLADGQGNIRFGHGDWDANNHPYTKIIADMPGQIACQIRHETTSASIYGLEIHFPNVTPNNTTSYFQTGRDSTTNRYFIESNGDFQSATNSYGSISDIKLKENIEDSGSQWDDIKAVKVKKYSMKEDNADAPNRIGVIAQDLEAAGMNGLVKENPDVDFDTKEDLGTTTKSVKYSILYMKAIKALQEAMARIETLETQNTTQATQIADLITRVEALEAE